MLEDSLFRWSQGDKKYFLYETGLFWQTFLMCELLRYEARKEKVTWRNKELIWVQFNSISKKCMQNWKTP